MIGMKRFIELFPTVFASPSSDQREYFALCLVEKPIQFLTRYSVRNISRIGRSVGGVSCAVALIRRNASA